MISIILLAFALLCFVLAALVIPEPHRYRLIALGLAFWVLEVMFSVRHLG